MPDIKTPAGPAAAKPGASAPAPEAPAAVSTPPDPDHPEVVEEAAPEGAKPLRDRLGKFLNRQAAVGSDAMHGIDSDQGPSIDLPGVVSERDTGTPEKPSILDPILKKGKKGKAESAPAVGDTPAVTAKPGETPTPPAKEEGAAAPPVTTEQPDAGGEADTVEFEFAGRKFPNRAKAEQTFKSLTGMFKSLVKRAEDSDAFALRERQAAQDWMAAANAAKTAPQPGSGAPTTGPNPAEVPTTGSAGDAASRVAAAADKAGVDSDDVLKAVDWKLFKQIHDEEGPDVATLWALSGVIKKVDAKWEKKFSEARQPEIMAQEARETITKVRELFTDAQVAADPTSGRQYYPELSDPVAAAEIGKVFINLGKRGYTKEQMVSPEGVHMTILRWRDWRNSTNNPWTPTAVTTDPAAPAPPSTGGNPQPQPQPITQDTLELARNLLKSLDDANSPGGSIPAGGHQPRARNNGTGGKVGAEILQALKTTSKQTQDWGYSED